MEYGMENRYISSIFLFLKKLNEGPLVVPEIRYYSALLKTDSVSISRTKTIIRRKENLPVLLPHAFNHASYYLSCTRSLRLDHIWWTHITKSNNFCLPIFDIPSGTLPPIIIGIFQFCEWMTLKMRCSKPF